MFRNFLKLGKKVDEKIKMIYCIGKEKKKKSVLSVLYQIQNKVSVKFYYNILAIYEN